MIQRLCPRCRSVLHLEEDNSLVFCWNCGAPQVRLSEELRELAERQRTGEATVDLEAAAGAIPAAGAPGYVAASPGVWRGGVQCAVLAGAVAGVLTLLSFALPPVVLFSMFWFLGAPIVALGVFAARFGQARITASFGARLGVLCALAIALAIATLSTIRLLLERFAFHSATALDTQMTAVFAQLRANTEAQSGAAAQPFLNMLALPEFRVGLLLASAFVFVLMYTAYSALAGAFAGYLRSRSVAR